MIERKHRIKDHREFQELFHNKKCVGNDIYVVYYKESKNDYSRVGVAVSKKLGNAVRRNLIKRQVRAIVRDISEFQEPFDAIIVVSKGYKVDEFSKCHDKLNDLWLNIRRKVNNEENQKMD